MKYRYISITASAIVLVGLADFRLRHNSRTRNKPVPIKYHLSDCHFHFVDFLQRTDGIKAALAAMDAAGVDDTMFSGMPLVKKWSTQANSVALYYLEDDARCYWYSATDVFVAREVQTLSESERKRIHPFICGFNGSDRNAVDHVQRMLEWYPGLWEGIGEVMNSARRPYSPNVR